VRVGSEEERAAAAGGEREEHQLLLHLAVTLTPRDDKELGGLSLQGDRRAVMFAPSLCALLCSAFGARPSRAMPPMVLGRDLSSL
jgi:hypothetical protein